MNFWDLLAVLPKITCRTCRVKSPVGTRRCPNCQIDFPGVVRSHPPARPIRVPLQFSLAGLLRLVTAIAVWLGVCRLDQLAAALLAIVVFPAAIIYFVRIHFFQRTLPSRNRRLTEAVGALTFVLIAYAGMLLLFLLLFPLALHDD